MQRWLPKSATTLTDKPWVMEEDFRFLAYYICGIYSFMFLLRGIEGLLDSDVVKVWIWSIGALVVGIMGILVGRMVPQNESRRKT